MTRYKWVVDRKAEGFPITMACKAADVSRQAFYDWQTQMAAGPTVAQLGEAAVVDEIRVIVKDFDGTYGEPRMTVELANRGHHVNAKRVARLMRAHGIVGVHKPTKVCTTIPAEDYPPIPDLIGRRFAPGAPDVGWVSDITYIRTGHGWLYLATVIDLGSRRLVGYHRTHLRRPQDGSSASWRSH
ncbi:MAG: IS3 family transposase [Gammaproteobacteria bacterium]|nr:IS3 family transposase [Gammaproteobacteria bacterium]